MIRPLSENDKKILLEIARRAIIRATQNLKIEELDLSQFSTDLRTEGASFVTLNRKKDGCLRGCIGTLEAYQPLVRDVQVHAIAAAMQDYRFHPVPFDEVGGLRIEISRLTPPYSIKYKDSLELMSLIKPGIHGVILKNGFNKATFLPQVWEQLPHPEDFLSHLCQKMGSSKDYWKTNILDVAVYQVEEFLE